jgi:hypothetical protein
MGKHRPWHVAAPRGLPSLSCAVCLAAQRLGPYCRVFDPFGLEALHYLLCRGGIRVQGRSRLGRLLLDRQSQDGLAGGGGDGRRPDHRDGIGGPYSDHSLPCGGGDALAIVSAPGDKHHHGQTPNEPDSTHPRGPSAAKHPIASSVVYTDLIPGFGLSVHARRLRRRCPRHRFAGAQFPAVCRSIGRITLRPCFPSAREPSWEARNVAGAPSAEALPGL